MRDFAVSSSGSIAGTVGSSPGLGDSRRLLVTSRGASEPPEDSFEVTSSTTSKPLGSLVPVGLVSFWMSA